MKTDKGTAKNFLLIMKFPTHTIYCIAAMREHTMCEIQLNFAFLVKSQRFIHYYSLDNGGVFNFIIVYKSG